MTRFCCEHKGGLGPPFPFCELCTERAIATLTSTWRSAEREKQMTAADVMFLLDTLLAERDAVRPELAEIRKQAEHNAAMIEMLTRGKSPCGHWSAYAFTEDGGKRIRCLQCECVDHSNEAVIARNDRARLLRERDETVARNQALQREIERLRLELSRIEGIATLALNKKL